MEEMNFTKVGEGSARIRQVWDSQEYGIWEDTFPWWIEETEVS